MSLWNKVLVSHTSPIELAERMQLIPVGIRCAANMMSCASSPMSLVTVVGVPRFCSKLSSGWGVGPARDARGRPLLASGITDSFPRSLYVLWKSFRMKTTS
ncbi:AraC family transcriptional regulator [Sesbania bispinosa]|nr:AraC family transcriptional regulator [Sesbania bispinosa]